jgi:hypothetical protein
VGALLGRYNGCVADKRVVDSRVRHKVGLELVEINIERTVETQTGGDGADNLGNQAVQMLIVGTGNVQAATADIVDSLVINKERAVRVLDSAVSREDGIVGLDDGRRHAGSRVYGEFELALLAVVGREALEKKGSEPGTRAATERVEDQEALERGAVVWLC